MDRDNLPEHSHENVDNFDDDSNKEPEVIIEPIEPEFTTLNPLKDRKLMRYVSNILENALRGLSAKYRTEQLNLENAEYFEFED